METRWRKDGGKFKSRELVERNLVIFNAPSLYLIPLLNIQYYVKNRKFRVKNVRLNKKIRM